MEMTSGSPQEWRRRLMTATKPVLLAYLRRDKGFEQQLGALAEACQGFSASIEVYLLDAEYPEGPWERYGFMGTPTFLMLRSGKEQARLLGCATAERLKKFILNCLGSVAGCTRIRKNPR